MPLIDVSIAKGRSPEQLRGLIAALHHAVQDSLNSPPDNITVIVREVELEHWSRANTTIAERTAPASHTDDK